GLYGTGMNYEDQTATYVLYQQGNLLSLGFFRYNFSGGAHGNYGLTPASYDLRTGRRLRYDDIFRPTAAQQLPTLLGQAVRPQLNLKPGESLDKELFVNKMPVTHNMYLTASGAVFVYQPYEIASYAQGEIVVFVPLASLRPLLRDGLPLPEATGLAPPPMLANPTHFAEAIRLFDAANSEDPNLETGDDGQPIAKELLYAQRMTACLARVAPDAPEAVQLAARCQHIRRWSIPRADFPMTRPGYHQWRNTLKKYHAELAGQLMAQAGYRPELIERVQQLVQKLRLKDDPEHPEEKIIEIVQKTWPKMTERGHALALQLPFTPEALALVSKALHAS
nr:hypothetical protein [Tanacetum cinerariifolium]